MASLRLSKESGLAALTRDRLIAVVVGVKVFSVITDNIELNPATHRERSRVLGIEDVNGLKTLVDYSEIHGTHFLKVSFEPRNQSKPMWFVVSTRW